MLDYYLRREERNHLPGHKPLWQILVAMVELKELYFSSLSRIAAQKQNVLHPRNLRPGKNS
jgi:hypothetical protein